jgi:outer membrane protein TolC
LRPGIVPKFLSCLCIAAAAARIIAGDEAPRLARRTAVAEALARNPQIAAARAQVDQARAGIAQATAFPDPAFAWTYEQQKSLGNFGSAQAKDVGATLTIPFPDKFRLNRRSPSRLGRGALPAADRGTNRP